MNVSFLARYLQKLPKQGQAIVKTSLYGICGGLAAVGFQLAIASMYQNGLVRLSHNRFPVFALGSLAIMVGSSLIVGFLLSVLCPAASGSGIPQLKLAFWKDFGAIPWRVAWVKFIAGAVSVGGGASLGREGPSVQLAGAVGSNLGALAGEAKQSRRTSAAAGAAAGLAAAFNAPLAAMAFVLEEIIGDLNSRLLGSVLVASVLGALVVHGIIGKQPAFKLIGTDTPTWIGYTMTPVVAVLAAVVGVYFQRCGLGLRSWVKRHQQWVPGWTIPLAGGLVAWTLGVGIFYFTGHLGVFGLGYDDLSSALDEKIGWELALMLLGAKFVATFCCYGFNGCGGIFSPCLFFGGMVGVIVARLIGLEWAISRPDVIALAVVGMSATLGSVVGAPVTGILIVFEMTHEFSLVPALMIGAVVSQAIARKMNPENFYDQLLTQDGHEIEHVRPPRDLQAWQQLPIAALSVSKPVVLTAITPEVVQEMLKAHPYQRFPVLLEGKLSGVLTRVEAEAAIVAQRTPKLQPATIGHAGQTVRDLQALLIESPVNFVVLTDASEQVVGVMTLHDLLRAEVQKAAE